MIEVSHNGTTVYLSGPERPTKRLFVTPAKGCHHLLDYELSPSGHQSLRLRGLSKHALELGYSVLSDQPPGGDPGTALVGSAEGTTTYEPDQAA